MGAMVGNGCYVGIKVAMFWNNVCYVGKMVAMLGKRLLW